MKKAHVLLLSVLMSCACSNITNTGNEAQVISKRDSIARAFNELLDTPETRLKRQSFGAELEGAEYKEYREKLLSKKEIRKWMLHLKATDAGCFDKESTEKILNGKWTMYRLDTLEHRLNTINKNQFDTTLVRNAIEQLPELDELWKKQLSEFNGLDKK